MAKSSGTSKAQFTYDFGIAIAQSTVNKVARLTGATLTLASAFHALKSAAFSYVDTLRENTLAFGGILSTMKAMEQAQNRLIKGQSYFSVDDQLAGMNKLIAVGIDAEKNLEWINKSAHAIGKSYAEFSGIIASAIQGNSQALVDAGLMTQRATRMFDKYAANTVMRQQAILKFVKNHKGLMNAIKNDFETIQDQMTRIKGIWKAFLTSIVGKPNDPQSFYGQIVASMKAVATALARNMEQIKRYGFIIGQTLGWVIKQIGHFVVWVGRQAKKALESVWSVTDDFQNQARSLLVWLEFWKLKIIDFFKEYSGEIKTILKLLIAYKALKTTFVIGRVAIGSILRYKKIFSGMIALQKRYLAMMGPEIGNKFSRWLQSLASFMPKNLRKVWVYMGKFFDRLISGGGLVKFFKTIFKSLFGLKPLFGFLGKSVKMFFGFLKNIPGIFTAIVKAGRALIAALLGSNPVGWIILAISLLALLYTKSKGFRIFMNNFFKVLWESLKFIYNLIVGAIVYTTVGIKKVWKWFVTYIWEPVANFFKAVWGWIGDMWGKFMNTAVGKWINDNIVQPIKGVFEWVAKAWQWVLRAIAKAVEFLSGANSDMAKNINDLAKAEGLGGLAIAASGGTYDLTDDTNYLNPKNWKIFEPSSHEETQTGNPLITPTTEAKTGHSTSMNFESGAVQIIVHKGDSIDETKLAQKVRQVISDMNRENNMRGGRI